MYLKKIFIIFIFLLTSNVYSEIFAKGAASIAVKKPNKIQLKKQHKLKKQLSLHGKSIQVNSMYLE